MLVAKIMAPLIPCNARNAINPKPLPARAQSNVARTYTSKPPEKIAFLPNRSAARPSGNKKLAADSKYAVPTQVSPSAPSANSWPMAGSATLTAEPMNGVRKAATVEAMRTSFLSVAESVAGCCVACVMRCGRQGAKPPPRPMPILS